MPEQTLNETCWETIRDVVRQDTFNPGEIFVDTSTGNMYVNTDAGRVQLTDLRDMPTDEYDGTFAITMTPNAPTIATHDRSAWWLRTTGFGNTVFDPNNCYTFTFPDDIIDTHVEDEIASSPELDEFMDSLNLYKHGGATDAAESG